MSKNEERTTGLRTILSSPQFYDFFQKISGGKRSRKYVIDNYVTKKSARILDIGCGTGYVLDFLDSEVEYEGFDLNETYINFAKKKYPQHTFHCKRVNKMDKESDIRYDVVIATGLLHHLNNDESRDLIEIAHSVLQTGGIFLTLDGVYTNSQSKLTKWVLNNDRGKHVRHESEYVSLATTFFDVIESEISDSIFRIPYTACILKCTKS